MSIFAPRPRPVTATVCHSDKSLPVISNLDLNWTGDSTRSLLSGLDLDNDTDYELESNDIFPVRIPANAYRGLLKGPISLKKKSGREKIRYVGTGRNISKGYAWEDWLIKKEEADRKRLHNELEKQREERRLKMKREEEAEQKTIKAVERRKIWVQKKDIEKNLQRLKSEEDAVRELGKREEQKKLKTKKNEAKVKEWLEKKELEKKKEEDDKRKRLEREELLKKEKQEKNAKAFREWCAKFDKGRPSKLTKTSKVKAATNRCTSNDGTDSFLKQYYRSLAYPEPSFVNPRSWVSGEKSSSAEVKCS